MVDGSPPNGPVTFQALGGLMDLPTEDHMGLVEARTPRETREGYPGLYPLQSCHL